jgi:gas vesicle protein
MGNKNAQNVLTGMVLGAVAGLLAGVLIAPDKGKNTRKKIKRRAEDLGDSFKDSYYKYKDDLKEGYDKYKKEFNRKKEEKIDHLAQEYDELTKK